MVRCSVMKKLLMVLVVVALGLLTTSALAANYIGNANTGKFHYANCSSVSEMNPSNKVPFNNRQDAINSGYIPCKRCRP